MMTYESDWGGAHYTQVLCCVPWPEHITCRYYVAFRGPLHAGIMLRSVVHYMQVLCCVPWLEHITCRYYVAFRGPLHAGIMLQSVAGAHYMQVLGVFCRWCDWMWNPLSAWLVLYIADEGQLLHQRVQRNQLLRFTSLSCEFLLQETQGHHLEQLVVAVIETHYFLIFIINF